MRYINKTGTPFEAKGKQLTKAFIDSCWNNDTNRYDNLAYDRSRMGGIGKVLIDEQADKTGVSYCCYCMRRLFLTRSDDGHKENTTYEHIIPHKIKLKEWNDDKAKYTQFPNLNANNIIVCPEGILSEEQLAKRITTRPYPHFISSHNLVASCDGSTFEGQKLKDSRCCNNNRKELYVMPIYLSQDLADGISYTSKGELDYDDDIYDSDWFDGEHLNLTNAWITLVRRMWYKVSKSQYTDIDIERARTDIELRQNIIDDIDSNNEISSWNESNQAWDLFSEYSWFYKYYKYNLR